MSEAGKERSDIGGGAGEVGSGGAGDEEDEGGGSGTNLRDEQKQQSECSKKGKRVALFRFRKIKKQLLRRNKRPSSATPGCLGKWVGGCGRRGGGGSCLCVKQPETLGSPVESQTSDPNNPEFTHELLRALMESNDFYSEECNTHMCVENLSPSCTDDCCN